MPHPFPAYLSPGYFDATLIANNSLVAYPFILTTKAFEVFSWAKDSLTEKPIPFWLQGAVVDSLWLGYLTV
ncbi:hypothetical protein ES706_05976 [subsurface metagenome]